jgi:rod shape-determining protein MreC
MNKNFFYIIVTTILVTIFYFKNSITNYTLSVFNSTKEYIHNSIDSINFSIQSHFNQAYQIKTLKKEIKLYQNYIAQTTPILVNFQKLKLFKQIKNPNIIFTQTISYAKLPDMSSIYINYDKNISIPKGLIYNNISAGIVVKNIKNYSLAYLNNNPNVVYTVFIGTKKVPGILYGGKIVKIKYIPKYHSIKVGDLVITSGLDNIFYEGVKVGKIVSISQTKLYQEAIITPFYDPMHPTFFYVVEK